ncbi:MAG: hypothetical protein KDH09_09225 [Chrysiogenetes bacterium]|nr:hypothetical protein [Chrysiogenetes bacterium]
MKKRQTGGDNATLIEAGRDVTINNGLNSDQMREVIEVISSQIPQYAAIAREIVDSRLVDFQERIIERFVDRDTAATSAFADPDFQYQLRIAQHAYARTDDGDLQKMLIDLIAKRSLHGERSRKCLTINLAIATIGDLTREDLALISVCFATKHASLSVARSTAEISLYFNKFVNPFLSLLPKDEGSSMYLASKGCVTFVPFPQNLIGVFKEFYGGVFSNSWSEADLVNVLPDEQKENVESILADAQSANLLNLDGEKFKFDIRYKPEIGTKIAGTSVSELQPNLESLYDSHLKSDGEIKELLENAIPQFSVLEGVWDKTSLSSLRLTYLGLAIGHSCLTEKVEFSGDLSIWIK